MASVSASWMSGGTDGWQMEVAQRAAAVSSLGIWWGFADWIAWAWMTETQLTMHFGASAMLVLDVFCPPLIADRARTWNRHLHVICCKFTRKGSSLASTLGAVNHFVYALPTNETVYVEPCEKMCAALTAGQSGHGSLREAERRLVNDFGRRGHVVFLTAADGNCAPDCVAAHDGRPSAPLSWKEIRIIASQGLLRLRFEAWFQDTWRACQEEKDVPNAAQPVKDVRIVIDAQEEDSPPCGSHTVSSASSSTSSAKDVCSAMDEQRMELHPCGPCVASPGVGLTTPLLSPPPLAPPAEPYPAWLDNQGSGSLSSPPHDGNLAVLQEIGLQRKTQNKDKDAKRAVKPKKNCASASDIGARLKVGSALNDFAKGRGFVIERMWEC